MYVWSTFANGDLTQILYLYVCTLWSTFANGDPPHKFCTCMYVRMYARMYVRRHQMFKCWGVLIASWSGFEGPIGRMFDCMFGVFQRSKTCNQTCRLGMPSSGLPGSCFLFLSVLMASWAGFKSLVGCMFDCMFGVFQRSQTCNQTCRLGMPS